MLRWNRNQNIRGDVWFKAEVIAANEEYNCRDIYPEAELKKAYKTYEGKVLTTEIGTNEIEKVCGRVVRATWDEAKKAVVVEAKVFSKTHPVMCHFLKEYGMGFGIRFGAQIGEEECSVCHHVYQSFENACIHVKKGLPHQEICRNIQFMQLAFDVNQLNKKKIAEIIRSPEAIAELEQYEKISENIS